MNDTKTIKKQNKQNKQDSVDDTATTTDTRVEGYRTPGKIDIDSDEDRLLASSQETLISVQDSTRHSTPESQAVTKPKPAATKAQESTKLSTPLVVASTSKAALQAAAGAAAPSGSQPKRKKSMGMIMKQRHQKAMYMLDRIAKNAAAGTVHERDQVDKQRYEAVVEEYKKFQERTPAPATNTDSQAQKRNRSQNESGNAQPKRPKKGDEQQVEEAAVKRHFSEVARNHLQVAIIDEDTRTPQSVQQNWVEIDVGMSRIVMNYVLDNPEGPHPEFDSSETLRGYKVIKCADQFSLDFLVDSVTKLSGTVSGLKLKLIPASEIPRRPRARVWLPPMSEPGEKLLRCIKLQNSKIPAVNEWQLIKVEEAKKTSRPLLLAISEESLEELSKADNKIRFGIRMAKMKIFRGEANPEEDDTEEVDFAGQLLMEVSITDDSKDVEVRADKS